MQGVERWQAPISSKFVSWVSDPQSPDQTKIFSWAPEASSKYPTARSFAIPVGCTDLVAAHYARRIAQRAATFFVDLELDAFERSVEISNLAQPFRGELSRDARAIHVWRKS